MHKQQMVIFTIMQSYLIYQLHGPGLLDKHENNNEAGAICSLYL